MADSYVYHEGSYIYEDLNGFEIVPKPGENYQTAEIWQGFDMVDAVMRLHEEYDLTDEQQLYLVVFRSRRNLNLSEDDINLLTLLDRRAEQEARDRLDDDGRLALLHYFKGMPDADRNCVSWCVWTDENLAKQAVTAPEHHKAALLARRTYEPGSVRLQKYHVNLTEDGVHIQSTPDTPEDLAQEVLLPY